jgi:hypothetical protein
LTLLTVAMLQLGGRTQLLPYDDDEEVATAKFVGRAPPGTAVSGVSDGGFFRVQARYLSDEGLYLTDENGYRDRWDHLQLGPAPEDWWSSYWIITREGNGEYRIENRWTGKRLIVQNVTGQPQVMLWTEEELARLQAGWQQQVELARRENRPTPAPDVYATTFRLEPREVGGGSCFRIGWSGGGLYLNNESGWSVSFGQVRDDWWSACWILRTYPEF